MRGRRLQEGIKRARRILRVWDARQRGAQRERNRDLFKPGGPLEQIMRFTRKPCSCPVCNDGRSVRGPTLQERRADAELHDELAAWEQISDEDYEALIEDIRTEGGVWKELANAKA